jgi:hypothetical protein
MLLGANYLRDSSVCIWRQDGDAGAADEADSNGPSARIYDDLTHLQSYPGSTQTTWYITANLGATYTIDTVCIVGLADVSGRTISVEIANSDDFTSNLQAIDSRVMSSEKRIAFTEMYHTGSNPRRYTGVQYIRIKITGTTTIPKVTEVFIGRRRQLKHASMLPYDNNGLASRTDRFESLSGVIRTIERYRGRRILTANFNPHEDARISDVTDFYETDTDFGTLPFCWWDAPNTSSDDFPVMLLDDPALNMPLVDWTERQWALQATEIGSSFVASE